MNHDDVDGTRGIDDASLEYPESDQAGFDTAGFDTAELDRSEALLAALGAGLRPGSDDASSDPLAALLADWRAETDAAPLPALPGEEEIAVALAPNVAPLRPRRGWAKSHEHHHGERPALWQAVTGAAAVAAVLVGGLSVAAHNALPGDPLWGVSKTIFAERAGDVELVSDLSDHLAAADAAARLGDRDTAKRLLGEVTDRLDEVADASERVELMKRRDAIQRDLSRVVPTAVPSPAPVPEPVAPPTPGAATLVPSPTVPVPTPLPLPPMTSGLPVIPLPLDGLRISTTLQIPIDPQRIQDFLSPTTATPDEDSDDSVMMRQTQPSTAPSATSVPTAAPTSVPGTADGQGAQTVPTR